MDTKVRCQWAVRYPELISYHDDQWGSPQHDDEVIFAAYAQCILHAGLNWVAFLKKRDQFRAAFDGWDIDTVAAYGEEDRERLMTDGPVRNLQKINAIINNARRFQGVQKEFGSFDKYIWAFVDNQPILCDHLSSPATKPARKLAADLKKRGFKFAGEATAIGLMQDIGMINDHSKDCFRYGTGI